MEWIMNLVNFRVRHRVVPGYTYLLRLVVMITPEVQIEVPVRVVDVIRRAVFGGNELDPEHAAEPPGNSASVGN
jgi:hypothetical protein